MRKSSASELLLMPLPAQGEPSRASRDALPTRRPRWVERDRDLVDAIDECNLAETPAHCGNRVSSRFGRLALRAAPDHGGPQAPTHCLTPGLQAETRRNFEVLECNLHPLACGSACPPFGSPWAHNSKLTPACTHNTQAWPSKLLQ